MRIDQFDNGHCAHQKEKNFGYLCQVARKLGADKTNEEFVLSNICKAVAEIHFQSGEIICEMSTT